MWYKSLIGFTVLGSLCFVTPPTSISQETVGKPFFRGELVYSPAEPIEGALSRDLSQPTPDCGANALYILLRLNGVNCERKTLHTEVPITGKGASMMDLQTVSVRYGVSTEVVKIHPRELLKCEPSIALITNKESETIGHYVVLLKGNDDSIDYIDGTTGGRNTCTPGDFERAFSGYALIVPKSTASGVMIFILPLLIVLELLGVFFLTRLYLRAIRQGADKLPAA